MEMTSPIIADSILNAGSFGAGNLLVLNN